MIHNGPWRIKDRVQKYKNSWLEVTEDQVIRPDGKPGIYGHVKMNGGISVLPLDENNDVYLLEEFHYAIGKKELICCSGGRDGQENYLDAAKRELEEELGITAKKWTDLGRVNPLTMLLNAPAHIYLAEDLKFTSQKLEGTDTITKIVKMKVKDAVEKIGVEITHGPSCVLILKSYLYLKEKNELK